MAQVGIIWKLPKSLSTAYLYDASFSKMSRTESTEAFLYGGTTAKIWVAPTKMLYFEKQNVKFTVKIVEFDYDTADDYVMIDTSSDTPTDLLETSVVVVRQNDLTKPIIALLELDRRELLRRTQMNGAYDLLLLSLMNTLQGFTRWV